MRYASLNAHKGWSQSRKDDLEAIGYIIVYFMNQGQLPWMEAELKDDAKATDEDVEKSDQEQLEIKEKTSIEDLCKGLPPCIYEYFFHLQNLDFDSKPDYKRMKGLFEEYFTNLNGGKQADPDIKFDWVF